MPGMPLAPPARTTSIADREKALGAEHARTATSLGNFALLFRAQGDLADARPLFERAPPINEKCTTLNILKLRGVLTTSRFFFAPRATFAGARPLLERALAIRERALGAEHPYAIAVRDSFAKLPS